jgi:hypothetical protein
MSHAIVQTLRRVQRSALAALALAVVGVTLPVHAQVPPLLGGGTNYACTLSAPGGSVQCWGDAAIIAGMFGSARTAPATVPGVTNVVAFAGGWVHACALRNDGAVFCWGDNTYGVVGDPNTSLRAINTPRQLTSLGVPAIDVYTANYGSFSCAHTAAFDVRCWGRNNAGQLGGGTIGGESANPVTVRGLEGVYSLALGGEHACALLEDGSVRCWGRNREGQLGNGGTTNAAAPVAVQGLGGRAVAIAGGFQHTCAVLESGSVRCWGNNEYGELGNGTTTAFGVANPASVSVADISDAVAITAGRYFTCALSANGTVRCWGDAAGGQLANGATSGRVTTPVVVSGLPAPAIALEANARNPCAVLANGTVYCWGRMFSTNRTTPVAVAGHTIETRLDMVEYRHVSLDYFFMTSRHGEKILLNNLGTVFALTANPVFKVHASPLAAANLRPITRYYFDQIARGNTRGSHFYTLLEAENAALRALNPTNANVPRLPQDEGIDSFAFLPAVEGVGGSCAAGQRPVYRAFRGQARFPDDPNHRFTVDFVLYTSLVTAGWDGEGVRFCVPN